MRVSAFPICRCSLFRCNANTELHGHLTPLDFGFFSALFRSAILYTVCICILSSCSMFVWSIGKVNFRCAAGRCVCELDIERTILTNRQEKKSESFCIVALSIRSVLTRFFFVRPSACPSLSLVCEIWFPEKNVGIKICFILFANNFG